MIDAMVGERVGQKYCARKRYDTVCFCQKEVYCFIFFQKVPYCTPVVAIVKGHCSLPGIAMG